MSSRVLAVIGVVLAGSLTVGCSNDDEDPSEPFVDGNAVAVPMADVEEPLRIRREGTLARLNEDVSSWLLLEDNVDWSGMTLEDLASLQDELNAAIDEARPDDLFELLRLSVFAEGTLGYCLTRAVDGDLLLAEAALSADGDALSLRQVGTEREPLTSKDLRTKTPDLDVCVPPDL